MTIKKASALFTVFPVIVLLSSCADQTLDSSADGQHSTAQTQIPWPKLDQPFSPDSALEARIDAIMAQMKLEDKIGQMIQGEIRSVTPEDVRQYRLGSVLNGGGTRPNNDKYASVQDWVDLADAYYEASMDTRDGGVAIPIIWGTDAVHGHNNVIGATLFPHNIGLGAAGDGHLVKQIAEATAQEVAATGIEWIFAPTLAVAQDDRWGRTYESYSENPAVVADYARQIVEGLQGVAGTENFLDQRHAIATAKHFVGDGGTDFGIDQGENLASEAELRDIHAAGYFPALEAGVQTVMASYNSWQGDKLHGHDYLLTTVLKDALGFDGFIVGDWNGHGQLPGCDNTQCAASINAGLDMFMVPQDWKALYENTLAQARSGEIPMSRIDDAVRRILRVKLRAGLFERGKPSQRPYAGNSELIGAPAHRELAREAVRKSLVLLKNDGQLLPLDPKARVAVVGDAADNLGKQTGGWTISWQGTGNSNEDFPGASTILDGIRSAVSEVGGEVIVSPDGSGIEGADVVIAVYGENPYAEMHGDITTYEYQPGNKVDLKTLQALQEQDIPVVSVFISGRPLWVNPELNRSQAFVAAWLPGSEGAGIADVLFKKGDSINYDFQGKLPFSWPRTPQQQLNYLGDNSLGEGYAPLFAWGYGLTYADDTTVGNALSEAGMAPSPDAVEEVLLLADEPRVPWQLFLQEEGDNSIKVRSAVQSGLFHTVTVSEVDDRAGYRRVEWTGERPAQVYLASNSPLNFSSYAERGVLDFDLRLEQGPREAIALQMSCGDDCQSEISLESVMEQSGLDQTGLDQSALDQAGQWQTLSVALNCFSEAGMRLDQVMTGFSIASEEAAVLSFGQVQLRKQGANEADLNCQ